MTYEGSAYRSAAEQAEVAESIRKSVARAEQERNRRRRDNIEDVLLVLAAALVALVIGIRVESIYLHDHEPVKCSSEDEVSVELTEDGFGHLKGAAGCVHIDRLDMRP